MKRCPYCGQEYSDEFIECPTDRNVLELVDGPLPSTSLKPVTPPREVISSSGPALPWYQRGLVWRRASALGFIFPPLLPLMAVAALFIPIYDPPKAAGLLPRRWKGKVIFLWALAGLATVELLLFLMVREGGKKAEFKKQGIACLQNLHILYAATRQFASQHGALPEGANWCESLRPYADRIAPTNSPFNCPGARTMVDSGYGFNSKLSGLKPSAIRFPASTILLFDARSHWNFSGTSNDLPAIGPHNGAYAFVFVDGHVEILRRSNLGRVRWDP